MYCVGTPLIAMLMRMEMGVLMVKVGNTAMSPVMVPSSSTCSSSPGSVTHERLSPKRITRVSAMASELQL